MESQLLAAPDFVQLNLRTSEHSPGIEYGDISALTRKTPNWRSITSKKSLN